MIWDFAGEAIPAEYLADLQKVCHPSAQLLEELHVYLNADELEALALRAETLVKTAIFPQPPTDRRAFPYPPL